jgi:transglutaminase-like putative cysteine protease
MRHAERPLPAVRTSESSTSELRTSVGVFVVLMLGCSSLHVLLGGVGWRFELAMVCGLVVGSAAAARWLTRRRFVPPVVAAIVLVGYVVARFAADTAILGVFPTNATVVRFSDLAQGAVVSIHNQEIPADVDAGILLFLVSGVGLIAFLVELTVCTLRTPAYAGIPLLVLLAVPGMTDFDLSDGFTFALTAAGYLWLLRTNRPYRRIRFSLAFGAVAIVGALIVPALLPPVTAFAGSTGDLVSTGLDPTIKLGQDLRTPAKTTALVYSTVTGDPHYLRLVTLEKFTGAAWVPDAPKQKRSNSVTSFALPVGLSSKVATTKETTDISISNFTSPWLPVPYPTSEISGLSGDWYWESGSLAVSSPSESVQGQNYQVKSIIPRPTPKQLSAAGVAVPSGFAKYLSLPATLPTIISDTARAVTSGESSNYATAIALQEYFRGSEFTYSETAPVNDGYDGTGMDVIAKFLEVKSGYCIHFASAMAVMARSLGIPSRVAVGFQPGTAFNTDSQGRSMYKVTSHDFHAWPELYFDGIGWVPFEPTPGRGAVPSYADLSVPGVPNPITPAQATPLPTQSAAPIAGQDRRPNQPGDVGSSGAAAAQALYAWLWTVASVLLLALLLSIPALLRLARRAGRLQASTATGAWRELLAVAEDVGLRLSATLTPREVAAALAPAAGGDGLERMRAAVERESYASSGQVTVDRADVREVTARLMGSISGRDRAIARFAPASVWRQMFRRAG